MVLFKEARNCSRRAGGRLAQGIEGSTVGIIVNSTISQKITAANTKKVPRLMDRVERKSTIIVLMP
jgi:hypothetical protein